MMKLWMKTQDITEADSTFVGGKALNLGKMQREGIAVPAAVCLKTTAFERVMALGGGVMSLEAHKN